MKIFLIVAISSALMCSICQATPVVYGKALLTLDYTKNNDVSTTVLNSTDSRIGIKGIDTLTPNTDVVYQLEYGIDIDNNNGGINKGYAQSQFYSRDTFLGLSNKKYGVLVAGRITAIDNTINYASQAVGLYDNGFSGASWDGNRINNSFSYTSPKYKDINFLAMYGLEGKKDVGGVVNGVWGVGIRYEPRTHPIKAGATYIESKDFKLGRVSGVYTLNPKINLAGLYQFADSGINMQKKESTTSLSGTYKTTTSWTAYLQTDFIRNFHYTSGSNNSQYILGGKYTFKPNAIGHIYSGYTRVETNNAKTQNSFGLGTGLEYLF